MFITMKESRIENNKSFYGCFYLGSFDSAQSLTVANALRRSLLSDCTGLAIISVKIENVQHEYSTLPGVRDSVLDIILNFKEIVLKKIKNPFGGPNGYKHKGLSSIYDKVGSTFFKPVVGYLKVRGPGIIRAKDFRLPPFIQCVDPNQYIATLTEDGVLNVKFVIMEGKSYYIQKLSSKSNSSISGRNKTKTIKKMDEYSTNSSLDTKTKDEVVGNSSYKKTLNSSNGLKPAPESGDPLNYWTITKKRQNLLNELKKIINTKKSNTDSSDGSCTVVTDTKDKLKDIKKVELNSNTKSLELSEGENISSLRNSIFVDKNTSTEPFNENSKQLNIDAVFNPVTKVNYIIEGYDNYIVESFYEKYKLIENLTSFLDSAKFIESNFPFFYEKWKTEDNIHSNMNDYSIEKNRELSKKSISKKLLDYVTNLSTSDLSILCTPEGYSHYKGIGIPSSFTESIYLSKLNMESLEGSFESGINLSPRHVVLLEIWTNGSLHPRDALLMALKNLSYTFRPDKVKMTSPIFSNSASYKKIIQNL